MTMRTMKVMTQRAVTSFLPEDQPCFVIVNIANRDMKIMARLWRVKFVSKDILFFYEFYVIFCVALKS